METYSEFVSRISALLPEASFSVDNDGQIVVYTNCFSTEERFVKPIDATAESDGSSES